MIAPKDTQSSCGYLEFLPALTVPVNDEEAADASNLIEKSGQDEDVQKYSATRDDNLPTKATGASLHKVFYNMG